MSASHDAPRHLLRPGPALAADRGARRLLLLVVVAVLAWQRVRGALLRAIASALLVLALTNPVLQREEREALPGVVALVVDESASQRLGKRTRADGARRSPR